MQIRLAALFAIPLLALSGAGVAQQPVKVGVIAPFSGPFASVGEEFRGGIRTWMKQHGDTVAGRKIEIIYKDTTGPSPEIAKRHAQDLVVRDKVDFLAGFGLTPEAMAVAPIATEAKKPMIIMNAATTVIPQRSPYIARVSMTLPQLTAPLANWALKSGIRQIYTLVSDYAPGIDAEESFKKAFTAGGGKIVDSVRVPITNPDFAPFIQRIKETKPEAAFVFLPAGEQGISFMKTFRDREVAAAGIKLIATGDLVDDNQLGSMGDETLGLITTHHYSVAHDSPENKAFLATFRELNPNLRPNFFAVGAYDGMAAIYEVVRKLGGNIDADKAMEVLKGWKTISPRGPIMIDPETRDVVQTMYVRRVQRVDKDLRNVEFDKFENVKDPGK
jgi:branched-chain amino acid transport system substrate-binding protein